MVEKLIPFRREHTGTFAGDNVQRPGQQAAQKASDLETRVSILETLFLQGRSTVEMQDRDQIITPAQVAHFVIRMTGALSAARNLRGFPRPANESETYIRLINNAVTGGFNVNVIDEYGSSVAFGAGGSAIAQFSPTGIALYVL